MIFAIFLTCSPPWLSSSPSSSLHHHHIFPVQFVLRLSLHSIISPSSTSGHSSFLSRRCLLSSKPPIIAWVTALPLLLLRCFRRRRQGRQRRGRASANVSLVGTSREAGRVIRRPSRYESNSDNGDEAMIPELDEGHTPDGEASRRRLRNGKRLREPVCIIPPKKKHKLAFARTHTYFALSAFFLSKMGLSPCCYVCCLQPPSRPTAGGRQP